MPMTTILDDLGVGTHNSCISSP